MIRIKKIAKPYSLVSNGNSWTKELMEEYYQTEKINKTIQSRYKQIDIKDALKLETAQKCAYCESKITHIYPGDIEHIIPKAAYPRLTFCWNNLTLVCYWCNNKKRDFVSKKCMLLNPLKDNIAEHLRAFGPLILQINGSKRGEITQRKLELNRIELREKRQEKIEDLQNLIDKLNYENVPELKDLIKIEIEEYINRSEFTFTLRQFYKDNIKVA